jgi:hypothetical protein
MGSSGPALIGDGHYRYAAIGQCLSRVSDWWASFSGLSNHQITIPSTQSIPVRRRLGSLALRHCSRWVY